MLTLPEGLRREVSRYKIRTTVMSPGAVAAELPNTMTDPAVAERIRASGKDQDLRAMTHADLPTTTTTIAGYRSAIEEFDRLWEIGTTQEQQQRMIELLSQIESFERMHFQHDMVDPAPDGRLTI